MSFRPYLFCFLIWFGDAHGFSMVVQNKGQLVKSIGFENAATKVALGSLWKIYAYAYLYDQGITVPDYICRGDDPEEAFCCKAGESIGAEEALKNSCGLYFEPKRLTNAYRNWNHFRVEQGLDKDFDSLLVKKEYLSLPVQKILGSLELLRNKSSLAIQLDHVLTEVVLNGTAKTGLDEFGSTLALKTFTVKGDDAGYEGGFAGWSANGNYIWIKGKGRSHEVIKSHASEIAPYLSAKVDNNECIQVHYFADYPIKSISGKNSHTIPQPIHLHGQYKVYFKNGNSIDISADGELQWDGQQIIGKHSLEDYVARVLDREFTKDAPEALSAMSVLVRSYVLKRGKSQEKCLSIPDSSRYQRVSPRPVSQLSRRIASKTKGIILQIPNVQYTLDSWRKAVEMEKDGKKMSAIINVFYPKGELHVHRPIEKSACTPVSRAQKWFDTNQKKIHRLAKGMVVGDFSRNPRICFSSYGRPSLQLATNSIFLEKFTDEEDQISLLHEYLHLALQGQPMNRNEKHIDGMARLIVSRLGGI